jgi:hypothetical protein
MIGVLNIVVLSSDVKSDGKREAGKLKIQYFCIVHSSVGYRYFDIKSSENINDVDLVLRRSRWLQSRSKCSKIRTHVQITIQSIE